jgi:1,2-diacylglycerol 3-beta-glucosyltransferase
VIVAIETGLLIILGFFLVYLLLLSILALAARRHALTSSFHYRQMAVVVPAHNEESTIEKTVRNLLAIDYPKDAFDVVVIADNCSDRTAEIARGCGASVYERQNREFRGKGYALRWGFDLLLSAKPSYDAVIVVDADSVVTTNLLCVMNSYLEGGARAIQCTDIVRPLPGAWSSEITRLGFTLYNYVRPLGRCALGGSAGLRGNGMCFSAETLTSVPWQAYSLAEDLEYGLILLLNGITVAFAPEANVIATMPRAAANAETQRARWEAGRIPIIRNYAGLLLLTAVKRMSLRLFDAFVHLVTPPLVNLLGTVVVLFVLNLVLWGVGVQEAAGFAWIWLTLVGIGVLHVLIGLIVARADWLMFKALLQIPRYVIWKLLVYTKLLLGRRTDEWVRTTRDLQRDA